MRGYESVEGRAELNFVKDVCVKNTMDISYIFFWERRINKKIGFMKIKIIYFQTVNYENKIYRIRLVTASDLLAAPIFNNMQRRRPNFLLPT